MGARYSLTKLNNQSTNQTCACRLPYAVVDKSPSDVNSTDTFVFLSKSNFEEQMEERENVGGERIIAAHTCTLTMLDKIDQCLEKAMDVRFTPNIRVTVVLL